MHRRHAPAGRVPAVAPGGRAGPPTGVGTPDPSPKAFSRLVFLLELSWDYVFLSWLSGALLGVGGSYFIGYRCSARRAPTRTNRYIPSCMYVCVYIYIYIYTFIYVYVYVYIYIYIHIYIYIYAHLFIYATITYI